MKKILLMCLLVLSIICNCCACSDNDDDKPKLETNYLGGYGEFKQEYGKTTGLPAFYDDEYIYITMPYLKRGSLHNLLNNRYLTLKEIIKYSLEFIK